MISILPPEQKQQIRYSKYNVIARNYLMAVILIFAVVGASLYAGHIYADQQIAEYESSLQEIREKTDGLGELQTEVGVLNQRLKAIEALLKNRTNFSEVLTDLASVMPEGAFINGISLTGEFDQPLELTITAQSRDQALTLRNALLTSPRIATADIQSITPSSSEGVNISIIIGFDEESDQS